MGLETISDDHLHAVKEKKARPPQSVSKSSSQSASQSVSKSVRQLVSQSLAS